MVAHRPHFPRWKLGEKNEKLVEASKRTYPDDGTEETLWDRWLGGSQLRNQYEALACADGFAEHIQTKWHRAISGARTTATSAMGCRPPRSSGFTGGFNNRCPSGSESFDLLAARALFGTGARPSKLN